MNKTERAAAHEAVWSAIIDMVRYIQNFSGMVVVIDALKRKKSVNHSMSRIALFITRLTLNSPLAEG